MLCFFANGVCFWRKQSKKNIMNKYQIATTIKLPIYLQKFVKWYFFGGKTKWSGKNDFNKLIFCYLEKQPKDKPFKKPDNRDKENFTFTLPSFQSKPPLYYNYISPEGEKCIRLILRTIFLRSLFCFMCASIKFDYLADVDRVIIRHGEKEKAIRNFCAMNNIPFEDMEEELPYIYNRFGDFVRGNTQYLISNKNTILKENANTQYKYKPRKEKKNKNGQTALF